MRKITSCQVTFGVWLSELNLLGVLVLALMPHLDVCVWSVIPFAVGNKTSSVGWINFTSAMKKSNVSNFPIQFYGIRTSNYGDRPTLVILV